MPDPQTASFRLTPNYFKTGEVATLRVEWLPGDLLGQELTLELVEIDTDAARGDVIAAFKAKVEGLDGAFLFQEVTREAVAADVESDMELPAATADTSRDGKITFPTKIAWRRAHLHVLLHGSVERHLVLVRVADSRELDKREGMVYELGIVVKDGAGEVVFDSGTQIVTLDCWDALIENCVAAAKNQLEGHNYLVEQRPSSGGDYYGIRSNQENKRGKVSTDCVTYALQVLDRAYAECRASADARYLRNNAQYGSKFAPALHEAGWGLVFFARDAEDLRRSGTYAGGVLATVNRTGKLWGKPVYETVCDYDKNGRWNARNDEWIEGESDPLMVQRYEELGETVPFAILALELGSHVVMKVGQLIYECHWSDLSTSNNLFDRGKTWEELKTTGCFFMAAPLFGLRPPPLPILEPIVPKLIVAPPRPMLAPAPR